MSRDRSRGRAEARPDVDAELFFGDAAAHKAQRRERMLCRQVHEAVSMALAVVEDGLLQDVWVVDVEPAPDGSRLAIIAQTPRGASPEEVSSRLERVAGFLRTEVAAVITRKRTPTLTFRVIPAEEEEGET